MTKHEKEMKLCKLVHFYNANARRRGAMGIASASGKEDPGSSPCQVNLIHHNAVICIYFLGVAPDKSRVS
jgi:hypothetical protein